MYFSVRNETAATPGEFQPINVFDFFSAKFSVILSDICDRCVFQRLSK